jgi:hypothetical protein
MNGSKPQGETSTKTKRNITGQDKNKLTKDKIQNLIKKVWLPNLKSVN